MMNVKIAMNDVPGDRILLPDSIAPFEPRPGETAQEYNARADRAVESIMSDKYPEIKRMCQLQIGPLTQAHLDGSQVIFEEADDVQNNS
jgi:hypothetical protein